ncbi:MAG: YihY/virulence factor BrkB family protein [Kiritimatiellales bacterium]
MSTGKFAKLKKFLNEGLWDIDAEILPPHKQAGLKLLRILMLVISGFKEDNCPLHASALTFTFVMALVPLLVIVLAVGKVFGFELASEKIMRTATGYGLPDTVLSGIEHLLATVESASAGAVGSISTVLFLWVAIKMLSRIEETFNLVWGVKTPRPLIDKIRNYIVVIVVAPILIGIASAGVPVLQGFAEQIEWMGPVMTFSLKLLPTLIMTLAFIVIYVFLPNTKVKISAALTGAFIAALIAILFQLAIIKLGIGVSKYNRIYGTLAAIPLFLFWVQITWMILLMGAEVSFSIQNATTYSRERLAVSPSTRARLFLAFAIMKNTADSFERGDGLFNAAAYGISNRIPIRLINDVIHVLSGCGLLTESAEHPGGYVLQRNPEKISARVIVDAVMNDGAGPEQLGMTKNISIFGEIIGTSMKNLDQKTLKDLLQ